MTWKSFSDEAYRLTEAEIDALIPEITGQYKAAIKSINDKIKDVYADILSGVKPADYYNTMIKYGRLQKLLDNVTKDYMIFSKKAGKIIGSTGQIAMSNNFYRTQFTYPWLTPSLSFSLLPADLVQMSVYGSIEAYKRYKNSVLEKIFGAAENYMPKAGTLSEFLASNRLKEIQNISRSITQGLLQGNSYTKTSQAIKDIIGQFVRGADGTINATGAMANSIRIVRTESTRILNEASLVNTEYARSEGIEVERRWLATLDGKTRSSHAALDNKSEDSKGFFHIGGDRAKGPGGFSKVGNNVRCRCTTYESLNGSEPTLRNGRNPVTGDNEVFAFKDFDTWSKTNGLKTNSTGKLF